MKKRELKLVIEVERDERRYSFAMDQGAPCGEAYDACHEVLQEILKIAQEISQRATLKKEEPQEVQE